MNTAKIYGAAPLSRPACWSSQHRCYELRKEQILIQVTHTLGNHQHAQSWLISLVRALNRDSPCRLLTKSNGYAEVLAVLLRIEYGVYM